MNWEVILMGICPVCGSFIDSGEPYCSDCGYIPAGGSSAGEGIDIRDFDEDELKEVLERRGYDLYDFENGLIDDDELEEILEELS